jgi:hypothetical protein
MLNLLPYALAAYGGYRGYKDSKDQGIGGINRLLNTITGAGAGYYGGKAVVGMPAIQSTFPSAARFTPFTQLGASNPALSFLPFQQPATSSVAQQMSGFGDTGLATETIADLKRKEAASSSILDIFKKKDGTGYDPLKVGGSLAALTYFGGAFDQGPTDIFSPGYNIGYANLREKRPGYTYIDPTTGEEKAYEKVYAPEADPANRGDFQSGPYGMNRTRLKTGGLAEIKKFNEGGINYLPSKMTHDENDSNNYVRASGYVEDGAGVGDKDEDTMLAQLADGEFVTRADGVLGAGIIAGANPNSMKDMREKGAAYFYEQQKRYKRVFDLLKENDANSKQKTN